MATGSRDRGEVLNFQRIRRLPMVLQTMLCLTAMSLSQACQAGAFSVSPVRLVFEPRDRAVALTLTNDGDAEVALQADLFQWDQDAQGADRLRPTEDLIVAPPSLKMPPRSRQVVRLALLSPRDPTRQSTYRLLVREIPEATAAATGTVQLPIALVLSLPVFITPPGARHAIECKQAEGQESGVIRCLNQGTAHAQVRRLELKQAGQIRASTQTSAYLLSGSQRDFVLKAAESPLPALPAAGELELTVWFDDGKTQTFGW